MEKVAETMERFERTSKSSLTKMKVDRVVVFIAILIVVRARGDRDLRNHQTVPERSECTFVIGADAAKIQQAISETYRVGQQTEEAFAATT